MEERVINVPEEYKANSYFFAQGHEARRYGDTVLKVGDEVMPYGFSEKNALRGTQLAAWQAGYSSYTPPADDERKAPVTANTLY